MMRKVLFLAVLCCLAGEVSAQSEEVWNRLRRKYDVVLSYVDNGMIVVNKGGQQFAGPGKVNGKYGYVDTLGREIVPPIYDNGARFRAGFAVVGMGLPGKARFGLIDRTGRVVAPCEWDDLGNVDYGVAVAYMQQGDVRRYSLVDTLGRVTPLEYDLCRDFSGGYAVVGKGTFAEKQKSPGIASQGAAEFSGKYGYIDPSGRLAIPIQYDDADSFEDDGLAAVGIQGKYYVKWGFIDTTGKSVVPCNYYSVRSFSFDRALVAKVVEGGELAYGYIDRTGKEIIPCRYDEANSFRFPNTWVGMQQDGTIDYRLIDPNGNTVLPYAVSNLQDGGKYGQAVAAIVDGEGRLRYGILSNSGRILLSFEYDQITIFSERDPVTRRWQEAAMATKDGVEYSFDISRRK